MTNRPKVALLIALAAVILGVFLSVSRAPALDEKAMMGTRTDVAGIAFDQLISVSVNDNSPVRIAKHAVNWAYTNWRGMTFGLLFGATILCLLRELPLWRYQGNRFFAGLQGLIGGAPLGVCVNCATPVAQGMLSAGVRVETSLAAMMASPTLNVIVISMMLSLFPAYFVLLKIALTVLFVLLFVPVVVWLTRDSLRSVSIPEVSMGVAAAADSADAASSNTLARMLKQTAIDWLSHFWFLVRVSVPLMLLAGLLGAIVIEFVPLGALGELRADFWSYLGLALVATLLPVPIAFDVVLVAGLLAAGVPVGLGMTLLFALSIFSLFPMLVIARDVSARLSLLLFGVVVLFSLGAGYSAEWLHSKVLTDQTRMLDQSLADAVSSQDILTDRITIARQLCTETADVLPDCVARLVDRDALGFPEQGLCAEISRIDAEFGQACLARASHRMQVRQAMQADDAGICETDACMIAYLKRYSERADSIARCDALDSGIIAQCRYSVLQSRLQYHRSDQACDIAGVDAEMCQRELALLLAVDQVDADVCTTLPEQERDQCVTAFVYGKVFETDGLFDCGMLATRSARDTCAQIVTAHTAEASGEWQACLNLPAHYQLNCVAGVIDDRVRAGSFSSLGRLPALSVSPSSPIPGSVQLVNRSPVFESSIVNGGLEIRRRAHEKAQVSGQFQARDAASIGMPHFWQMTSTDIFEPFGYGKGIASADIDGDGLPEVVIAYEKGAYVYKNLGAGGFELAANLQPDSDFNAFVVTLVDFNNDDWVDLFLTGYGGKRVIYLNHAGQFNRVVDLPAGAAPVTLAAGFADLDQNGRLDLVLGNWAHGVERNFNPHLANNELWYQENGTLNQNDLFAGEPAGQTLSVLLSDINNDGRLDIVTGNDRQVPDVFYIGQGERRFSYPPIGFLDTSSLNTMTYESADFNNDLRMDLYSTDMKFSGEGQSSFCNDLPVGVSQQCRDLTLMETMVDQHDVPGCLRLEGQQRADCLIAVAMTLAIREQSQGLCEKVPAVMSSKRRFCELTSAELPAMPDIALEQFPTQVTGNRMHWGRADFFLDVTEPLDVSRTNWSWNARALDVDQDGFMDLFIGNGYGFGSEGRSNFLPDIEVHSNVLFQNRRAASFVSMAQQWGIDDYANTPAFTVLDVDADGDLDLLTYAQLAGPTLFENQVATGNSVTISLKDQLGNTRCVGCRVTIETASGQQMREIKLSGGFLSFDQPIAHFGLGVDEIVLAVRIVWSTGQVSRIEEPLQSGYHYEIIRPGS